MEIDRDAAHELAEQELGKPIYPTPSLTERLSAWFDELLYRIAAEGSTVPGGWFTITVLALLVVVAVIVAVRVARRAMGGGRGAQPLFTGQEQSAGAHRATAEQLAAAGDWAGAIRHRLRAVARHLEETGVLAAVPGRTATELARDAAAAFPGLGDEFSRAATAFNDVTYGERPGTEAAYRLVAGLDDHLQRQTATAAAATSGAPGDGWAAIR